VNVYTALSKDKLSTIITVHVSLFVDLAVTAICI